MFKRLISLTITGLFLFTPLPAKSDWLIDLSTGSASTDDDRYDKSKAVFDISVNYQADEWEFSLGSVNLNEFELKNSNFDGVIEVKGAYLEAGYRFETDFLDVKLSAGGAFLESEIQIRDEVLDETDKLTAFAGLDIIKSISDDWDLRLGYRYFDDVGGASIGQFAFGARYSF